MVNHQTVIDMFRQGVPGPEIAKQVDVSFGRVYHILHKAGLSRKDRGVDRPPDPPVPVSPPVPAEPKPPRVVDKIQDFLAAHPESTAAQIQEGIGHSNRMTVACLLSRLREVQIVKFSRKEGESLKLWSLAS